MAAPFNIEEEDENGIENSSLFFTTPVRVLFGGAKRGLRSFFRYARRAKPVFILTRNVTADTQTLDPLMGTHGLIRTTGGYLNPDPLIGTTFPTDFTDLDVGEWGFVASATAAGNANADIPSAATSDGRLFEIHQILTTIIAVGVASRTMTLLARTAMPSVAGMAQEDDFLHSGPTITDAQQGRIFVPRAPGLIQNNDNGTITTTDASPLPILCGDALLFRSAITAGLAADSHRVGVLARRVA
jgi:hypothetical protein